MAPRPDAPTPVRPATPLVVAVDMGYGHVRAARPIARAIKGAVAAGEPVRFTVRPPRYAVQRTVLVVLGGEKVETRTVTVSEGGLLRVAEAVASPPKATTALRKAMRPARQPRNG